MDRFGEEVLVPLAGIFCVFGLPVLAFVFFRVMAHRERMALIARGLAPGTPAAQNWAPKPPSGRAARAAAAPAGYSLDHAQTTLRKGITLTFIGFAITLGLSFIGLHESEFGTTWHPGPWLLGGLIPMFIGLAQVIIAVLSGAALRPPQAPPHYGAEQVAPPPAGDMPHYDSSYTYRPGATPELRSPLLPPERKP